MLSALILATTLLAQPQNTTTMTPHDPAPASVVLNPHWLARPGGADIAAVYPAAAVQARLHGRATLACAVTAEGTLTGCAVASESPVGAGFGEAALKLAPKFRMSPRTNAGETVGGGRVRIPITFRIGS